MAAGGLRGGGCGVESEERMKYITPPSTPAAGDVLWTNETDGEYRLVRVLCVVKHGTAVGAWVQLLAPTFINGRAK